MSLYIEILEGLAVLTVTVILAASVVVAVL